LFLRSPAQEAELTGNILLHLQFHHVERTIRGARYFRDRYGDVRPTVIKSEFLLLLQAIK